jgi:hypothetical protein
MFKLPICMQLGDLLLLKDITGYQLSQCNQAIKHHMLEPCHRFALCLKWPARVLIHHHHRPQLDVQMSW